MGLSGHFQDRRADRELCSVRDVAGAEVKIDVKLVSCQRPTLLFTRKQCDHASVHDCHLRIWIRRSIRHVAAAASFPIIADEADNEIKFALFQDFALPVCWTPYD